MDSMTALPERSAAQPLWQGVAAGAHLRLATRGPGYEEIAREERVTIGRVRQIASEALQRQKVDGGSGDAAARPPGKGASAGGGGGRRWRDRRR